MTARSPRRVTPLYYTPSNDNFPISEKHRVPYGIEAQDPDVPEIEKIISDARYRLKHVNIYDLRERINGVRHRYLKKIEMLGLKQEEAMKPGDIHNISRIIQRLQSLYNATNYLLENLLSIEDYRSGYFM